MEPVRVALTQTFDEAVVEITRGPGFKFIVALVDGEAHAVEAGCAVGDGGADGVEVGKGGGEAGGGWPGGVLGGVMGLGVMARLVSCGLGLW